MGYSPPLLTAAGYSVKEIHPGTGQYAGHLQFKRRNLDQVGNWFILMRISPLPGAPGGAVMAKRRTPSRILGLDLGSYAVKAIEMTRSGNELFVSGYAYEPVFDSSKYSEAVWAAVRSGGLDTDCVAIGVAGQGTFAKVLQSTIVAGIELERTFKKETSTITQINLETAPFAFQPFEPPVDGSATALVAATPLDVLNERLGILKEAGIVPDFVEPEVTALANAFEVINRDDYFPDAVDGAILVDVGAEKTLFIGTGNNSHLFREFPFGGNALTEMVAHRLDINLNDAERVKCDPGGKLEVVRDAMYPGIEQLGAEMRTVVEYYKTIGGSEPGLMLISGGLAKFPDAIEVLGRLANIRTLAFDSFGKVAAESADHDFFEAYAHVFPLAFGLACRVGV